MVSRALREYKELPVLALMALQAFKDQPEHLALLELMVQQVPRVLVQLEPRVLLELLAQLALMVPQVLQELVLLELLVYKAQLGPVVLPELRAPE